MTLKPLGLKLDTVAHSYKSKLNSGMLRWARALSSFKLNGFLCEGAC